MKNGFLTFCFAFMPGAGQMYQGYMKRGLSLVSLFFGGCALVWLAEPLMLLLPIVWMYSFFDTFNLRAQRAAGTAPEDDYLIHLGRDVSLSGCWPGGTSCSAGCWWRWAAMSFTMNSSWILSGN